jgi:hypothetical protein
LSSTAAEAWGAAVGIGVHVGECEVAGASGPVFDAGAALASSAAPGEVVVSRTVVDLVAGSGLRFADRGTLRAATLQLELPALVVV